MSPTDVRNLVSNNHLTQMDKRYDMSVCQFALLKVAQFFSMLGGLIKYMLFNGHSFHNKVT